MVPHPGRVCGPQKRKKISVADPGCLSRIPGPDFYTSRIPDFGSQNLFCSHKFHKIVNYFIFEMLKTKMWANFQRIIELFTQKLSLISQKYEFGIRDPEKTYSGSRIHGLKKHRIPDPQHWKKWRADILFEELEASHGHRKLFSEISHLESETLKMIQYPIRHIVLLLFTYSSMMVELADMV